MQKRWFLLIVLLTGTLLFYLSCEEKGVERVTASELIEKGWQKQLRLIQAGLAEKSLVEHLQLSPLSDDGRAGLAFACLAQVVQEKFQSAIDAADAVLSSDSSWTFGHDSSIDHLDLRLLQAQSYYALANYSMSLEIVQHYFDPNFNVNTDTPEGKTELAGKIESLWTG